MKIFTSIIQSVLLISLLITANKVNCQNGAFNCGNGLADTRDGQTYQTVLIGTQCWMAENLNYGSYVPAVTEQSAGTQASGTKYCQNVSGQEDPTCSMGGMYEWATVMNISNLYNNNLSVYFSTVTDNETCNPCGPTTGKGGVTGICPDGWHIPTLAEFNTLTDYLASDNNYWCNGNSSYIAKSLASTGGWTVTAISCQVGNNETVNNYTGFNAQPAGKYYSGSFSDAGSITGWWSVTEGDNSHASAPMELANFQGTLYESGFAFLKSAGYSVRCLEDADATKVNELFNKKEGNINIYPNPAKTEITIDYPAYSTNDNAIIELLSLDGRLLVKVPIQNTLTKLDISELSEGTYIVKVSGKDGTSTINKIVKE